MKNIHIDKSYNLIEVIENPYINDVDQKIDAILEAEQKGIITKEEKKVLVAFVLGIELQKTAKGFVQKTVTPRKKDSFLFMFNSVTTRENYA